MWAEGLNQMQDIWLWSAQAAEQVNQDAGGILTYVSGALNVTFIGLFLTEQIYPKGILKREQQKNDEYRDVFVKEVLPALIKVTTVLEALPDSEAEVIRQLRKASTTIQNLTRRLDERGEV